MPSLPLKVTIGIRDTWDSKESTLQKSLSSLHEVLGYEVLIAPEWPLLLAELGTHYADKTNFVASVAGTVACWAKAMTELLEDDANEAWTEEVLEKLKGAWSKLRVFLEVTKGERANTAWDEARGGFVIGLPGRQVANPMEFFAGFKGQLLGAWEKKGGEPLATRPGGTGVAVAGDDWADVAMDSSTGKVAVVEPVSSSGSTSKMDFIPDFGTLPRPDELLLKPPYHLFVYSNGKQEVEVQCSHSPTLQFLADYLKKWCRANHQVTTKPPSVEFRLEECAFGLGLMYDRLTLYAEKKYGGGHFVSPTIVLALVEGVLGYEKTYSDGMKWIYRKDIPFKSL